MRQKKLDWWKARKRSAEVAEGVTSTLWAWIRRSATAYVRCDVSGPITATTLRSSAKRRAARPTFSLAMSGHTSSTFLPPTPPAALTFDSAQLSGRS